MAKIHCISLRTISLVRAEQPLQAGTRPSMENSIDIFLTKLYNEKTKGCDDYAIAAGKDLYHCGYL
jgi:hypothetical protein